MIRRRKPKRRRVEPSGKTFIVVSGLPRSGTSLMMQMFQAAGIDPMTDHVRAADDDNPEGYLEWEAIKQIKNHPELMDQAEGKVTKVISMLIPYLPTRHEYKIVFMVRPIDEIAASQQKMIQRLGSKGADVDLPTIEKNLTRHRDEILGLIRRRPNMTMRVVRYKKLIEDPQSVVDRLVDFFGDGVLLHPERMASVVRPELYRNRTKAEDAFEKAAELDRAGLVAQPNDK